ncbi:hypothetical protein SAMN05444267_100386 [Chryseobacterium polytrichastri]|uniref:Uncharacterized protein n=1 Tax=Chryseobacterium polytrichastri TaxID=1302687 RepID=A0A1M6RUY2_9FLAO|nr:hypothetical protein SAMN05444267_100386 [Chryseobacterium polytrichastri]
MMNKEYFLMTLFKLIKNLTAKESKAIVDLLRIGY